MSAIPAGLSFLASMASQYPPFQKAMQNVSAATAPTGFSGMQVTPQPNASMQPNPVVPQPLSQLFASQPASQNSAPTASVSIPATNGRNLISQTPASSPPTVSQGHSSQLCENCHTRPKFVDSSTGKAHPYCSKSCATAAKQNTSALCVICHVRPKRVDGTRMHDYCSKSCAQKASLTVTSTHQNTTNPNPHGICQIPGCTKPVHKNPTGPPGRYCGLAHKQLAETACLYCRKAQKQGDRHFCGQGCADEATKKSPMILEVPEDHQTFKSVEAQFQTSWRHVGRTCPTVRHIYKIVSSQSSVDKYSAYRDTVEARGHFVASGRSAGNENRRWHGTRRECRLGDKSCTAFCSSTSCSLCCIMRTSYDVTLWGKKTGWGRFGAGIYTSSTSSKSNDYAQNTDSSAPLKAILLNKVVVGKGYKMTQDNTSMTAPPAGFDSVLAEKGARLNHDELVVYCNEAIRPSYLVMYDAC